MPKLSDEQIKQRLLEGRNYKRLYCELKLKYDEVKAENRELREALAAAQAQLQTQAIQIAELQTMVFGKQKRPGTGMPAPVLPATPKQPRM
jgi:chromosome condensin MukBEF complex kleisin-like MukF subunit